MIYHIAKYEVLALRAMLNSPPSTPNPTIYLINNPDYEFPCYHANDGISVVTYANGHRVITTPQPSFVRSHMNVVTMLQGTVPIYPRESPRYLHREFQFWVSAYYKTDMTINVEFDARLNEFHIHQPSGFAVPRPYDPDTFFMMFECE